MMVARPEQAPATAPLPFFLPAPPGYPGQRFCLFHFPAGDRPCGWVLHVAPFAEEMNKSRRMAALQARALCAAGYGVLQIDLLGCGDSSGDFGDASWEAWVADIGQAARWLLQQGPPAPLWLWGQRAGALLAAEAAQRLGLACHFLFWQPSVAGKAVLQQFLRLKLAGGLADGVPKGAMDSLRQQLAEGGTVDVAGYRLAAPLANGLSAATLAPPLTAAGRVVWLEVSSRAAAPDAEKPAGASPGLLPASAGVVTRWREAGWSLDGKTVNGPAFWQTTEIEDAPQLIEATLAALATVTVPGAEVHRSAEAPAPASTPPPTHPPVPTDQDAQPLWMGCRGDMLLGMLHRPAPGSEPTDLAVVVVVGGPQYRVGSHRHFVQLARRLAAAGYPVMSFDYRGMGDSTGAQRSFEAIDVDIATAIDQLQNELPQTRRIVLWGLCDGASAALLYLFNSNDPRVAGLCLLNPWVRSDESLAITHVKHYYLQRLREAAFWRKLLRGQVAWAAAKGLWQNVATAAGAARRGGEPGDRHAALPYQAKMLQAWTRFRGGSLLLLSGRDYTAKEFLDHTSAQPDWRRAIEAAGVQCENLTAADHTFSGLADAEEVNGLTLAWLRQVVETGRDAVRAKVPAGVAASSSLKPKACGRAVR